MKLFRTLRKPRPAPVPAPIPVVAASPAEEADWAAEDECYAIDKAADLDGLGLMRALAIHRHRPISLTLEKGKRHSMLHRDVLTLLYYLARKTADGLLRLGYLVREMARPGGRWFRAAKQSSCPPLNWMEPARPIPNRRS